MAALREVAESHSHWKWLWSQFKKIQAVVQWVAAFGGMKWLWDILHDSAKR